jgi:hypothetical protein
VKKQLIKRGKSPSPTVERLLQRFNISAPNVIADNPTLIATIIKKCPLLEQHLVAVYNPASDGNCGPRAIAIHAYHGDESRCVSVRKNLLSVVMKDEPHHQEMVRQAGASAYADLTKRLSYASDRPTHLWFHLYPDFHIAATFYHRPMVMASSKEDCNVCMPRGVEGRVWTEEQGLPPWYFAHVNNNHYVAIDVEDPYTTYLKMLKPLVTALIEVD